MLYRCLSIAGGASAQLRVLPLRLVCGEAKSQERGLFAHVSAHNGTPLPGVAA